MKYKIGDEVLVKAKIIGCSENGIYDVMANRATILETSLIDKIHIREDDIVHVPDMTAEEAWKLAIKLRYMDFEDKIELFNLDPSPSREAWLEIMENMSPESVRDKIEAWEAEKEIKVGDVVIETSGLGSKYIGVVTQITGNQNSVCMTYSDGSVGVTLAKRLKKTGRRIDITGLLNQIGGDE